MHRLASPLYLPVETRSLLGLLVMTASIRFERLERRREKTRLLAVQNTLSSQLFAGSTAEFFRNAGGYLVDLLAVKSIVVFAQGGGQGGGGGGGGSDGSCTE
ncbi:unnamed protein product, partial [Phaeothamnion confervicola]